MKKLWGYVEEFKYSFYLPYDAEIIDRNLECHEWMIKVMNGIFIYFLIEYPSEVLYMVKRDKKIHKKKVNETSHITLSNKRYYIIGVLIIENNQRN